MLSHRYTFPPVPPTSTEKQNKNDSMSTSNTTSHPCLLKIHPIPPSPPLALTNNKNKICTELPIRPVTKLNLSNKTCASTVLGLTNVITTIQTKKSAARIILAEATNAANYAATASFNTAADPTANLDSMHSIT